MAIAAFLGKQIGTATGVARRQRVPGDGQQQTTGD
jgi:hypothetical protein